MRPLLLALAALVVCSAPSVSLASRPDLPPTPAAVLDLLGRCRDELPALGCHAEANGHGSCDPTTWNRFVELDLCDASGAFAPSGPTHVCGVRWSDCVWCTTDHALVLPWRAGPWPADLTPSAAWARRAATCAPGRAH